MTASMVEVRVHGRGGQGVQVGCQILAGAFFRAGRQVQAFAAYGGERRGAPVTGFVRADDSPIRLRCDIERPRYALVLDPTMLDGGTLVADVPSGGTVVLNSAGTPAVTPPQGVRLIVVDATGIAGRAGLGPIVSTALLGAFAQATGLVSLEGLLAAVQEGSPARRGENLEACAAGYHAAAGATAAPASA
ncbi:MAG: 2-oxoacid:acceptor oxidoreductase family protein [Candidatus Rokubacteria bacterium]|nr:2-oxoacid:acceptor oxidoreductase family protein [Candidatus Rokubacteria bacterium]